MQIFMAYHPDDAEFADYLARRLKQTGAPVWIDLQDAPNNHEEIWYQATSQAYASADMFIGVLSRASVKDEQMIATWQEALVSRRPIIAAVTEPCAPPFVVKKYADFSRNFEAAFHTLIHILFEQVQRIQRPRF